MHDVAIIGAGPAGLAAALTLQLHNKSVLWFGSKELSHKVDAAEKIANYPGMPYVSGTELNKAFQTQIEAMHMTVIDCMVTQVAPTKRGFMILGGSDVYQAKAVLLATGIASVKGFPGEGELLGKGISYCATCDGFLYRNKTIAVYNEDARFEHEVQYLADMADKVYYFPKFKESNMIHDHIQYMNSKIKAVLGEERVLGLELTDGSQLDVDGCFILRNAVSPASLLNGLQLEEGRISVDRTMSTNIPGCYAAGDCTGRPYQIAKAVGEGNVAAHSIIEYLSEKEDK